MSMIGLVGRQEYLRVLLQRYGPNESLSFVIEEELGLRDSKELLEEEQEDEPTKGLHSESRRSRL